MEKPRGIEKETIEDVLKRADKLAGADWHSGLLCANKDLRRIVLIAFEYRKLINSIKEINANPKGE